MEFKKILLGIDTFSYQWLTAINKINKPNIFIFDFSSNQLLQKITGERIDYIVPLSENDNIRIQNISSIDKNKILYPNRDVFDVLNNKLEFTRFMMQHFIHFIPRVFYFNNVKLSDIEYPVISKPIYSTNASNIKLYCNETDFSTCKDKIIIQAFIEDIYEYSAYLLCIDGKIINWKVINCKYSKHYIKTHNFSKYYKNIDDFPIELFEPIIVKLNYTGGMTIDFKFNKDTNEVYIFEINPRFGGSAFANHFIYELLCIPV